jgi:Flp pilus assembly protein TadG
VVSVVRTRRRAQGLVEFVLVLPVIVLFLAVVADAGRFLHVQMVLEQVCDDAARYASIKDAGTGEAPTLTEVRTRVDALYPTMLLPYQLSLDTKAKVGGDPAVSCALSCTLRPYLANLVGAVRGDVTLGARATRPRR